MRYIVFKPIRRNAAAYFAAMPGALEVTTLLLYEFRQAVRFQMRLHRHDPLKGYARAVGN